MPDYNPAVAAGFNPPQTNILPTLEGIAQLQIGQAHAGLYSLEALRQQRELTARQAGANALSSGKDPGLAYFGAGGQDSSYASGLQSYQAQKNAIESTGMGTTPELSMAQRKDAAMASGQFQANPSQENYQKFIVGHARQWFRGANDLETQNGIDRLASIKDPAEQMRIAKSVQVGGLSASEQSEPTKAQLSSGAEVTMPRSQFIAGGQGFVGQTPAAKAEQEKIGAALGEQLPKLQEDADNAKNMNFTLGQMEEESQKFTMGAYARTATTFAKYLKPIANSFGNHSFDEWVGSNEDFGKNAGVLARQAVREISARPSQLEFQTVSAQMPHDAMSQQGFKGITDQFRAINDFKQAKAFAGAQWQTDKGTMAGFEADWNKHVGPAAFLVANMSPEQRKQVSAGLSQSQRESLVRQLKWAHDQGLENGVF